jgi:WD40 repeat protein
VKTFRGGEWAMDTAFAPNGKTIANTSVDDTVRVWAID